MAKAATRVVVTCEHGGNRIPPRYRSFFRGKESLLETHEGYDAGALALARRLAGALDAPLIAATTSRLLIDLNRSPGHPGLYSAATRSASPGVRHEIMERHYRPYRRAVEGEIGRALAVGGRVVHLSCHTFTPSLHGRVREADIGLLYDPARPGEVDLCSRWRRALQALAPHLRVRRNYPYRGTADGFTSFLRRRHPAGRYLGIEIEVNQKHALGAAAAWHRLRETLAQSLRAALSGA